MQRRHQGRPLYFVNADLQWKAQSTVPCQDLTFTAASIVGKLPADVSGEVVARLGCSHNRQIPTEVNDFVSDNEYVPLRELQRLLA